MLFALKLGMNEYDDLSNVITLTLCLGASLRDLTYESGAWVGDTGDQKYEHLQEGASPRSLREAHTCNRLRTSARNLLFTAHCTPGTYQQTNSVDLIYCRHLQALYDRPNQCELLHSCLLLNCAKNEKCLALCARQLSKAKKGAIFNRSSILWLFAAKYQFPWIYLEGCLCR